MNNCVRVFLSLAIYWRGKHLRNNRFDIVNELKSSALFEQKNVNEIPEKKLTFWGTKSESILLQSVCYYFRFGRLYKSNEKAYRSDSWLSLRLYITIFFVCCSRNEQDNFMAFFQCCSASLFATTSLSFISFNLLTLKYSPLLIPYSVGETGEIFVTILCFFLRDG